MKFNYLYLMLIVFLSSCYTRDTAELFVTVPLSGSAPITLEKQPVHYKYAEKWIMDVNLNMGNSWHTSLNTSPNEIVHLKLDEISYPVVLSPGRSVSVTINRVHFPLQTEVKGYPQPWNVAYQEYLIREAAISDSISDYMPDFREGGDTPVLDLFLQRIALADSLLGNTPLKAVYYANVGEYLNRALQFVPFSTDPLQYRSEIFEFAKSHSFFSFESLYAQRAGIRDFAHNYAMSFGVQDSLRAVYGEQLAEQDIKRLGYTQLNQYREEVLEHITERKALAYAEMHLVAKRLGEISLDIAEPTFESYLEKYPEFNEYNDFLTSFHSEIKRVSPGQPAIPFTLPNQNENPVSMEDFSGKYVLIDFWASWCIPCLDEFPHMLEIYENTSRDDFEIVAISTEGDSLRWRDALQRFDNPWVQLYGGNEFQQETFVQYRGGGIPFYILINREGNIERYNDIRATFNLEAVLDSLISLE
jgi:thiol-disulfide isomerase/thioredoxin